MNRDCWFASAIFFVSLTIYVLTLCPTIYWEDSAAFVTAAHVLGIPHSPGFPVYVLLGRLFSLLPVNNPAWPVNFMSALFGSLSLAIFFLLAVRLLGQFAMRKDASIYLTSAAFALLFGFTTSFWSQTFRAEVYTLNFFFTIALIFILWKWSESVNHDYSAARRCFFLFAFLWGLSAANHSLLAISLALAFLLFTFLTQPKFLMKISNLIAALFFGILGATPYLFLLLRSRHNPALNWGKPDSWAGLWKVVSKSGSWQESLSMSNFNLWTNFSQILMFIAQDILLPVLALSVLGSVVLFRQKRRLWLLFSSILLCNILVVSWAAEFSARNLDLLGYLLPGLVILTIWAALGAFWIVERFLSILKFKRLVTVPALTSILLLLPAYQLIRNFNSNNHSRFNYARQYAESILQKLPPNSVVIAADDNTLTSAWYLTCVEKYRSDVTLLAWSALENLDYLKTVKSNHPELTIPAGVTKAVWIAQFARSNPRTLLYCQYVDLPRPLERHLLPDRFLLKYYPQPEDYPPASLMLQLDFLDSLFRNLRAQPKLDLLTREHFGNFFFNWGAYFDRHSYAEQSFLNLDRALQLDSGNDRYFTALGKAFLKSGRPDLAQKFFSAAAEINPYREENQRFLAACQDSLNLRQSKILP